jgi:recombination protein RecR
MSDKLPRTVQRLIKVFAKLPGVGQRTAMRFVLHLVQGDKETLEELVAALQETIHEVTLCSECFGLTDTGALCRICDDPVRNSATICVVESIGDLLAIEGTGEYGGRYFVLHRLLSPLKGIGPTEINLPLLYQRIQRDSVDEVVIATPLTTDGETTATFLARTLSARGVRVTRPAAGLPVGGTIEYLDRMTLTRAFQDRKDL